LFSDFKIVLSTFRLCTEFGEELAEVHSLSMDPDDERDFTKYNMFKDQHLC